MVKRGVVKESLRLMHGIIVGPPRLVPASGVEIDGYFVPPKVCNPETPQAIHSCAEHPQTVVTTSSMYLNLNDKVFPHPESFNPARWAHPSAEMERSLVPFSRGRRMCPGKEFVFPHPTPKIEIIAVAYVSFGVQNLDDGAVCGVCCRLHEIQADDIWHDVSLRACYASLCVGCSFEQTG